MSNEGEMEDEDGRHGSSFVSKGSEKEALELASYLFVEAKEMDGRARLGAEVLHQLKDAGARPQILDELVSAAVPERMDVKVLQRWLDGGYLPFPKDKPKAPIDGKPSVSEAMDRLSKRVGRFAKNLTKRREDVEKAKVRLAEAEAEFIEVANVERAATYQLVAQHLAGLLSPIFAMGPAWTLLRVISDRLPPEVIEARSQNLTAKEREGAVVKMQKMRSEETVLIAETLDHLSGDVMFEEQVRKALLEVCRNNEERRLEAVKEGRRLRSKQARLTRANPLAVSDADEVLDGLPKAT